MSDAHHMQTVLLLPVLRPPRHVDLHLPYFRCSSVFSPTLEFRGLPLSYGACEPIVNKGMEERDCVKPGDRCDATGVGASGSHTTWWWVGPQHSKSHFCFLQAPGQLSRELPSDHPDLSEGPGPSKDSVELLEVVGGVTRRGHGPQPPPTTRGMDVSFVVQFPRLAQNSRGEMGKEGQVEEGVCSSARAC
jgi:hypothetical protein